MLTDQLWPAGKCTWDLWRAVMTADSTHADSQMLAAEPLDPAGYRVSPVGILLDLGPRALLCGAVWLTGPQ